MCVCMCVFVCLCIYVDIIIRTYRYLYMSTCVCMFVDYALVYMSMHTCRCKSIVKLVTLVWTILSICLFIFTCVGVGMGGRWERLYVYVCGGGGEGRVHGQCSRVDMKGGFLFLFLFFVFCVPQLYLWGSLLGEIFAYVTVF